jgi:hypothetical protein
MRLFDMGAGWFFLALAIAGAGSSGTRNIVSNVIGPFSTQTACSAAATQTETVNNGSKAVSVATTNCFQVQ